MEYLHPNKYILNNISTKKAYLVVNIPRTIEERVFKWWQYKSAGYINDIREAKIFLEEEIDSFFNKSDYPEWENKKFAAIPIEIIKKYDLNVIPFIGEYVEKIKNHKEIIGNKRLYLNSEEIKYYS